MMTGFTRVLTLEEHLPNIEYDRDSQSIRIVPKGFYFYEYNSKTNEVKPLEFNSTKLIPLSDDGIRELQDEIYLYARKVHDEGRLLITTKGLLK